MTKLRGRHRQVFLYENCLVFTKKEPGEMDNSKDGYIYQFKNLMKVCYITVKILTFWPYRYMQKLFPKNRKVNYTAITRKEKQKTPSLC